MKVKEERETLKKKAIAFKVKATPLSFVEEDSSEYGDEDLAMLIQKVGKMFYKKEDKITSEEEDIKEDLKRRGGDGSLLSL